ncbi:MAG: hydroxyacylglutathione hydrolase [Alphaproteobacteria bacterium GM7ARS4]|nr:hydroxyacylglutathione hydrolase [Alphaproteobacteria bacterium GM7ARS4]
MNDKQMLSVRVVPVLQDNYSYIISNGKGAYVVDPPELLPVREALGALSLEGILLTHKHGDHVAGVCDLVSLYGGERVSVYGPRHDGAIEGMTSPLADGETLDIWGDKVVVMAVCGHTKGHIAYYMEGLEALFCGDCLFSMGCGRVFEGTYEDMWRSLCRLRALPDRTRVYCGHEYTLANGAFACAYDKENDALKERVRSMEALRGAGQPTLPVFLGDEKRTNPFLRADDDALKRALSMEDASALDVFSFLRDRRNAW